MDFIYIAWGISMCLMCNSDHPKLLWMLGMCACLDMRLLVSKHVLVLITKRTCIHAPNIYTAM